MRPARLGARCLQGPAAPAAIATRPRTARHEPRRGGTSRRRIARHRRRTRRRTDPARMGARSTRGYRCRPRRREWHAPAARRSTGSRGSCTPARCRTRQRAFATTELPDGQRPTPQRQATAHCRNRLRARQEIHRTRFDRGDACARHRGRFPRDRPNGNPDRGQWHRSRCNHCGLRSRRSRAALARSSAGSLGRDRRPGLAVSSGLCRRDARAGSRLAAGRPDPLPRSHPGAHSRATGLSDTRSAHGRGTLRRSSAPDESERDARRREPEHVDAR